MENQKKKNESTECESTLSVREMPSQPSKQVQITYSEDFPNVEKERQIHPRRKAPPISRGRYVEDETPSDAIKLEQ